MPSATLRLLASTVNAKGDLFTRLMKDFFFAIGYEDLQYDVAKSGREIDIQGKHRIEPKLLRAECKAHEGRMGGTEVNTFRGALTVERAKAEKEVVGYFVSLGGYTANAIEQESELGNQGINLIGVPRIVAELEGNRIIADDHAVTEQAGRCVERAGLRDIEVDGVELLGHLTGYIKVVYYARNRERTHFALLHYLTPLAESAAKEIIEADRVIGGILHTLKYLAPEAVTPNYVATEETVMEHYRRWLADECGYIQLDGLPADANISPKKLELEQLFVPLRAILPNEQDSLDDGFSQHGSRQEIRPIGELLESNPHLALLASPGGGKSTLLKRLATAYAFPERLKQIQDSLPDREWLPLFLRCRELRERAGQSILSLLEMIPKQMNMPAEEAIVFNQLVLKALRGGQILLLVDGLDEISDEQARKLFAHNLRVFLAVYPQIGLVVTSREAGYRLVAGVIADACQHAKLAPFNKEDVSWLCLQWNIQVGKDTLQVRAESKQLAEDIWRNGRIRALAENPLLLTTLLVVKRWVGQLPRNRVALYNAAVKVLLMTWNVEGFEPLEEDETITQLSYVACAMMERGTQRINYRDLLALLQAARQELQAELQDARITAAAFIKRVEYRSSLLMRTGQELADGELQDVYEFRHLTFQEYLAARGYASGEHPERRDDEKLVDVLSPHFMDESWREVVPLAAVLAKRYADPIIKQLTETCEKMVPGQIREEEGNHLALLGQCLVDEAIALPDTLNRALKQLARLGEIGSGVPFYLLFHGKYSERLTQIADDEFMSSGEGWYHYLNAYDNAGFHPLHEDDEIDNNLDSIIENIIINLESQDVRRQTNAALELKDIATEVNSDEYSEFFQGDYHLDGKKPSSSINKKLIRRLQSAIEPILLGKAGPSQLALCWALAWITETPASFALRPNLVIGLYKVWHSCPSPVAAEYAMWALAEQTIGTRYDLADELNGWPEFRQSEGFDAAIMSTSGAFNNQLKSMRVKAELIISWYARTPWNDEELAFKIKEVYDYLVESEEEQYPIYLIQATAMLQELGDAGQELIERRRQYENGRDAAPKHVAYNDNGARRRME